MAMVARSKHLLNLGIAGIALLIFTACAFEDPKLPRGGRRERIRYEPRYDERICAIPKDQGDSEVSSRNSKIVTSAFFGKRYDRSLLEGVLAASAIATGRFMSETLGGRVYRIPRDSSPGEEVCPMFTELSEAPDDLRDLWEQYPGAGMTGWRLAGLYFEDCGREGFVCSDHEMVRPTIMIDEGRDRWTLVHEMMHFNFSRERKRDPHMPPLSALSQGAHSAKSIIKASHAVYRSAPDRALLSRMQAQSSWLTREWFYHTMVHTVLEEVAVEGLLMDEYLLGRLKHVSPSSLNFALKYMERSQQIMLAEYDSPSIQLEGEKLSLRSLRAFIYSEAKKHNWVEILRSVEADVAFFSRLDMNISEMIAERRARTYEYQFLYPAVKLSEEASVGSVSRVGSHLHLELAREAATATDGHEHVSSHIESSLEWRQYQSWKDR